MKDVGAKIEKRRKSLGLSVRDVEDQSGVSVATIYRIESGDPKVKEEKRARVLRALEDAAAKDALVRSAAGVGGGDLADLIEQHAKGLMELARRLRATNGDAPRATAATTLPATRP